MHISHVELRNFRRLAATRIDFAAKTTLFVGANNSGKTSAMTALRMFLAKKGNFCLNDLPVSLWRRIDEIGKNLEITPDTESIQTDWHSILPSLDVWVHVGTNELHRVSHLLPTLDWNGEPIGVRLQLEPTSNDDFHKRYREARKASCDTIIAAKTAAPAEGKESDEYTVSLWPASMCEFLERRLGSNLSVKAYLLDPTLMVPPQNGVAKPQEVPADREPLEADPFRGLIRIDEINAQRGFSDYQSTSTRSDGDETQGSVRAERSRLSEQLRDYYRIHLDPSERPAPSDVDALQAIHAAQKQFDEKLRSGFSGPLRELENLGYPGVNNPHIKISTRIKPTDGLSHDSAVKYEIAVPSDGTVPETYGLPEQSNGLGYQNLISMIFRLIGFRDAWMRVGKAGIGTDDTNTDLNVPPPIHLVLLEEPEAHLHAQVQQVFIKKAHDVLRDHSDLRGNANLTTQLVVSTHSGHIAHETDFASMRYFRREPASGAPWAVPTSTVVNLSEVFGSEDETARFVTRYLKATHCDLFFADGAIFAEGAAERILIPHFIRGHFPELTCCYLTLLEVGGSHTHRFEPLIKHLGLNTLIVADLDAASPEGRHPKRQPQRGVNLITRNPVLKSWIPGRAELDVLLDLPASEKERYNDGIFSIRVAYQTPVKIQIGAGDPSEVLSNTFEDAIVLANITTFKTIEGSNVLEAFKAAVNDATSPTDLTTKLFESLSGSVTKAEFALDMLTLKEDPADLQPPDYIYEGLTWLQTKLRLRQQETIAPHPVTTQTSEA